MTLKSLSIHNFRNHRKRRVVFDPHITTICGESFRGKSNLLRSIRLVALNRPSGNSFVRWGHKSTQVTIGIDKHKVKRSKGKGTNLYQLDDRKLSAFGNDVPNDVQKLFNVSDINFQLQHDPHFWFNLSPGEVSRRLNRIVNLQVIDQTTSNISREVTKSKAAVDVCQDRLKEASQHRKELAYVTEMAKDFQHLQRIQKRHDVIEIQIEHLTTILDDIGESQEEIEFAQQIARGMSQDLEPLFSYQFSLDSITKRHQLLFDLLNRIHVSELHRKHQMSEQKIAKQQMKKIVGRRCPLCGKK